MDDWSETTASSERAHRLAELMRSLAFSDAEDQTQILLAALTDVYASEGAILWLLNDEKQELYRAGEYHGDESRSKAFEQEAQECTLRLGQGLAGLAWAENRVKILQLPAMFAQSPLQAQKSQNKPVYALALPLGAGGKITGVLELVNCTLATIDDAQGQKINGTLANFVGNYLFGTHASEQLQGARAEIERFKSLLGQANETVRELKERLGREHDRAAQTVRYHNQFLTNVSRDLRTHLSGITSVVELMHRADPQESDAEYVNIIKESSESILHVVEQLVEFNRQETQSFKPAPAYSASVGSEAYAETAVGKPESAAITSAETTSQAIEGVLESEQQGETPGVGGLQDLNVLIVNGLLGSAELIEAYATASGIKCAAAFRGQSAITTLKQAVLINDPYDIVFVERLLPDMDAFEFAHAVKQDPTISNAKLVLVSAFDSAARDTKALRAGFSEHIARPTRQQQVIATLLAVQQGLPSIAVEEQVELVREQVAPAVARGQRMILVAEDNPVNQKVALLQLRELGFFGTVVSNGQEAIDVLQQARFDAVLMDCQMPQMDGYEATRSIRAWEKNKGRHVPIIAMTASTLSYDRDRCFEAGMDDYLSKPVTYDKLETVLSKWIASADAGEQLMQQNPEAQDVNAATGAEPIDIKGLNELLGPEEAEEVLRLFVQSTEDLISQIGDAAARHDGKMLKDAAHQLKGAAASVGANGIARKCKELEDYARTDRWESIPQAQSGLAEHFAVTRDYIDRNFS